MISLPKFKLLVSNQCRLQGDSSGVFGWTWQHNVPLIRGLAHRAQSSNSQYGPARLQILPNLPMCPCSYNVTLQQCSCQCAPVLTILHWHNVPMYLCSNIPMCRLKILPNLQRLRSYFQSIIPKWNTAFFFILDLEINILRWSTACRMNQGGYILHPSKTPNFLWSLHAARWWGWFWAGGGVTPLAH